MISALLVATHIINFQGNLRKFVKDLSGPTHPTTQYSGLLDCFPLVSLPNEPTSDIYINGIPPNLAGL